MGRKNVVKQFLMFDGADLSGNLTSDPTNVINLDIASIHIRWDGASPDGEIFVDVRNGEDDEWYTLSFSTTILVSGNTGDHQILFTEMPFTDIRLRYVANSGSGDLFASLTMKTTGA